MGLRLAVANGNWSLASTWNGGVVPTVGDTVASNGFTVTIDQNVNVDSITNTATSPISNVPQMTSATAPSGIVTTSGEYSSEFYFAWKAFDRGSGTWLAGNSVTTGWVAYEFTAPRVINAYTTFTSFGTGTHPRNWTFEGWDGASWIVLHTVTNNSATTYTGTFTNSTAYIKYRINVTAINGSTNYLAITELSLFSPGDSLISSVAGGGFILGENVTLNCTGSIPGGATTVLTWNGATGTTSTINTPFIFGANVANINTVFINGTGTLNINVTRITGATSNVASRTLFINSNCTVNIVGDIAFGPSTSAVVVLVNSVCTLNITGTITHSVGSGLRMLSINAAAIVNITGSVICSANSSSNSIVAIGTGAIVTITGSITNTSGASDTYAIDTGSACSLRIVGSITGGFASPSVRSTSSSAINLLTGPFISSDTGILPIYVTRMHYRRTLGSYYEFRDNSTNGALPPAANAPTTRLNSPEVGSDLPVVTDVRFGTTYGYGSLTGTVRMPTANQVTYGIPVDNTFGAAVLTAASVWDYLVDNITTANSIGSRLKNVSTPQTVGSQLASLL